MVRTPRRLVGLALAGLLISSCASTVPGTALPAGSSGQPTGSDTPEPGQEVPTTPWDRTGAVPRPLPGGEGAGVVPAGLEEFYQQELIWGSCAAYATGPTDTDLYTNVPTLQCADLIVPLDYEDPSGPTVAVAVLKSAATGTDRIGSLLLNPGGPGASGMFMAAQFGGYGLGTELHSRFDYVGFDTRGTGSSKPLVSCSTPEERDEMRAMNLGTEDPADIAAQEAATKETVQRCTERTGAEEGIDGAAFLATVGSTTVIKDMDVLRSALGDEKMTYIGYSYGTLLGTLYAEEFGANVRAMILDGAVDNSQTHEESLLSQATGFQEAFDNFAAFCTSTPACILGDDASQATEVFQSLVRPLLDEPAPVDGGRVLSFSDAITAAAQAMYADMLWPQLAQGLADLADGDGTGLMQLADSYEGREADGSYSTLMDAFVAIRCVDDERKTDPAEAARIAAAYAAAAPFTDSGQPPSAALDACAYWPAPVTLEPHTPSAPQAPELMVISTTGDPATPFQAGVDLAEHLDATLVIYEGNQHTAFLTAGSTCLDDAGTDYLVNLADLENPLTCS